MRPNNILIGLLAVLLLASSASAWLSGYDHRVPININNTGDNLTYYQYNFTVDTASLVTADKMVANGSDCRITNSCDVLQEFWNETPFDSSGTKIWVNATVLGNVSNTTHYFYYGNSGASSVASISDTFDFGDDFGIDTLVRVSEASNPTRTADDTWEGSVLSEQTDFHYGGEYISWYRGNGGVVHEIGFENSTDGITWNGYSGNPIISNPSVYAHAVQDGDCFYLFVNDGSDGTGSMYLYNVTDYTNPIIMNSGNAVYTRSSTATDWDHEIFNPGVAIDGDGRWHMLLGGRSSTSGFRIGYAYSNLTELNWSKHRSSSYVIDASKTPDLVYVPDRNALLSLYGSCPGAYWKVVASYANLSDDLTSSSNWYTAGHFELSVPGIHIDDPCMVYNFNTTYPIMISYNYDQAQTHQCYYTTSLNGFYDRMISPNWDVYGPSTHEISDGVLTISTIGGNSGIFVGKTTLPIPNIIEARAKTSGAVNRARFGVSSDTSTSPTNQVAWWWAHGTSNPYVASYVGSTGGYTLVGEPLNHVDYHNYKVEWLSGSLIRFYYDDEYKVSRTSGIPITDLPVWMFSGTGTSGDSLWEWVFARQYAATPPTTSLGIEDGIPPTITLHSSYPPVLYTNFTGQLAGNYIVEHSHPLNLSTLAYLCGVNYTVTGDMHSYIEAPPNSISAEGIYRAPNRNRPPYMSWENNATITEGNVWQWGGGDNSSWWIAKNSVNSTHTWINVTGVTEQTLQSSSYISKRHMYAAPKTAFEVNRQQGLIIKVYDNEQIRGRTGDYLMRLYFDTAWESTVPTHPIEMWYCNSSFDPTTDDPTGVNCAKLVEWDGNRWVNHSWVPSNSAAYASPHVMNATIPGALPGDINYIYLKSGTIASKSYVLNATDYDPGICNITFAQTNSMWTYNELTATSSPVAYTPSFFTVFVRDNEEFLHHMYVADDQGTWGHSEVFSNPIIDADFPVDAVAMDYFNVSCPVTGFMYDEYMDATYDSGYFHIGMTCPGDPDGGTVSHNLTLHYTNETFVCVINDTFTTTGTENVEINFTTTPYYSTADAYTLKCVSIDDEGNEATYWLDSYFTLAADGTQGYYTNDYLMFWGMTDIPTLYAFVNNNSLMSYDAVGDIYTMHVPFFKSKCNDTFMFDEDVHLQSNNDDDVAYFKALGTIYFENCDIRAWNTLTDTVATEYSESEQRAYLLFTTRLGGHIKNCDMSYLGTDVYRQEGINFVGIDDFVVEDSTFGYNSRGVIFEDGDNISMTGCTCSNNYEVGTGIYYTGNMTVSNGIYDHNGHSDDAESGIRMYQCVYNTIRDTIISDSAMHGVWMQYSNHGILDACGITNSGSGRDYYLSSYSTNNTIIDATQSFTIRTTSSSDVNITTTDNQVFTETSQYIPTITPIGSYMRHHGVSATFSVGMIDMYITPHNGSLAMSAFVFDETTSFTLATSDPITYVEINATRGDWVNSMWLDVGGEFYAAYDAGSTGNVVYNYTGGFVVSPLGFSIHERVLEGWQALGQDTTESYSDLMMIIGICVMIVVVGGIIIGLRSFAGEISPEILIIIAIAIGFGLLVLITVVEIVPSVMEPMENITMEGL